MGVTMIKNFLSVGITDYCNFHCYDCPMMPYRVRDKSISTENLDIKQFERMLLDCFDPPDTVVELTGGEPTLADYFCELLEMLNKRGFPVTVLTNCTKLSGIPEYGNLKIIGSWYDDFMSLEYLKKQVSECRNDLYMALYVNREDRAKHQEAYNELGLKQIVGSWNDDDAVIKSLSIDTENLNKISITNNIVCKCFAMHEKLINVSKYDGSEKAKNAVKTGGCDICEKSINLTCHIIYKSWQVMNGKEFTVDLSKYDDVRLQINSIKRACLANVKIDVL